MSSDFQQNIGGSYKLKFSGVLPIFLSYCKLSLAIPCKKNLLVGKLK